MVFVFLGECFGGFLVACGLGCFLVVLGRFEVLGWVWVYLGTWETLGFGVFGRELIVWVV